MTAAAFKFNGLNENRLFGRDRANNASVRIFMAKERIYISGTGLLQALEVVRRIMKESLKKRPDMTYVVDEGGVSDPSLAVVFTFDRKTLRHKASTICSENARGCATDPHRMRTLNRWTRRIPSFFTPACTAFASPRLSR